MALDKHELKLLLRELKNIFATKEELKDVEVDIDPDLLKKDYSYIGSEPPEDTSLLWFDNGSSIIDDFEYNNPIIDELYECIQMLQEQVKELQAEVEYLKINGGGGVVRPPDDDNPDEPDVIEDVILALEDGSLFLLEDGGFILTEETITVTNKPSLTLEDGSLFLLEDGGIMLLEESISEIKESILLLENGYKLLFENDDEISLEKII